MPDEITVKMTGVEEIMSSIQKLAIASPQAVKAGTLRVAMKIERQAKAMCAVDTGRLRASISTNWTGSGKSRGDVEPKAQPEDGTGQPQEKSDTFTAVVGTNVKYGPRIEFGFVGTDSLGRKYNQAERPYLYPAYFSYEGEVKSEISAELGKELAKAMKK